VLELDPNKCEQLENDLAIAVTCGDARSWTDTAQAVDSLVDVHGGIDTLVQCVGLFDFYRGLKDLSEEELDQAFGEAFAVNVMSHLISVKSALPALVRSKGNVVLTASTSSFYPGRGGILYVASKFAVRGIVTSLAHELAPDVRVNAVAPGGTVGTDLRGFSGLGLGDRSLGGAPDRAAEIAARSPLGVALTPADVSESFVFLASDAARGMTGRFLHPDGGVPARG
jgi:NAD(P)-dependent dehydrogenase (short-subunit alcohol dehydrogenase family)